MTKKVKSFKKKKSRRVKKNVERDGMDTLLFNWMEKEHAKYIPPQRKGTPKGEPIGLSEKKHLAALLCLTNLKLKDIAKYAKVSYSVLRKWRTEKEFRAIVTVLSMIYAERVWDFIFKIFEKQDKRKIPVRPISQWTELGDIFLYSDELIGEISGRIDRDPFIKKKLQSEDLETIVRIYAVTYFILTRGKGKPLFNEVFDKKHKKPLTERLLNNIEGVVKGSKINRVDKEDALGSIKLLRVINEENF